MMPIAIKDNFPFHRFLQAVQKGLDASQAKLFAEEVYK